MNTSIGRRILALVLVAGLTGACVPPPTPRPTPTTEASLAPDASRPDFDTFVEQSYSSLLRRDPQLLTELGLAEMYGVGQDQLADLSDEYTRQTYQFVAGLLAQLREYDRARLTREQALTYDIYAWYLDDFLRGEQFIYNSYPVSFMITTGQQLRLQMLLTDLHLIRGEQDARDYLTRLGLVDDQFAQLVDGLQRREQAGVVMPGFLIPWVLGDLQAMAFSAPRATPFYTTFEAKLAALPGLTAEERQSLLAAAEQEIAASVIPAYRSLAEVMAHQQAVAPTQAGVWQFDNGEAYYAYTLRHHTTTDLTADEIYQLGLRELERIHLEMRTLFDELGYPADTSLADRYARVAREAGMVRGEAIATRYAELIDQASRAVADDFDLRPRAAVKVIAGESGNYYMPPAVDGSRPGLFYALVGGPQPLFSMPTLAYHEAVPGHHFQLAIALEQPLPAFRRGVSFDGYVEGWALYAERLAWELGFYQDDPYGDLGRLQAEAFRAARLVVDTGLHAMRWTYDQAFDFMLENTGLPATTVQSEVGRYIVFPGQATSYMIGMLKILELRERARETLGERFDLKAFHNTVLGSGAVPLSVLEQIVDDYIAAAK